MLDPKDMTPEQKATIEFFKSDDVSIDIKISMLDQAMAGARESILRCNDPLYILAKLTTGMVLLSTYIEVQDWMMAEYANKMVGYCLARIMELRS